jgi:hypothetical protein
MRKTSIVTVLVAVALAVPISVYASHQFTDVPNSNMFHNSIDWMKDNGITVGCNPPANTHYCPNDNVTRGQMAAFMKRLAENNVVDAATVDGKDSLAYTNPAAGDFRTVTMPNGFDVKLAELSLQVPVAGGLVLNGQITPDGGGFVTFWFQVDDTTCNSSPTAVIRTIAYGTALDTSGSAVGVVALGAGSHTVSLCGWGGGGIFDASLVAQFVTSVSKTGSLIP